MCSTLTLNFVCNHFVCNHTKWYIFFLIQIIDVIEGDALSRVKASHRRTFFIQIKVKDNLFFLANEKYYMGRVDKNAYN